ncbi:MAG: hypothetical protein ACLPVF_05805 [Acidimicrobiales bacterium]
MLIVIGLMAPTVFALMWLLGSFVPRKMAESHGPGIDPRQAHALRRAPHGTEIVWSVPPHQVARTVRHFRKVGWLVTDRRWSTAYGARAWVSITFRKTWYSGTSDGDVAQWQQLRSTFAAYERPTVTAAARGRDTNPSLGQDGKIRRMIGAQRDIDVAEFTS